MIEIVCKACRSAPVACEGMCLPCLKDRLADDKERRRIDEQRQRQARRHDARKPGASWDRALLQRVLKTVAFALVLTPLVTPPVHAEPPIMVEGRVDCGLWLRERSRRGTGAVVVETYLLGTLNGLALGSYIEFWDAKGRISREQAYLWVDNWCRANPLSVVANAAMALFDTHTAGARLVGKQ